MCAVVVSIVRNLGTAEATIVRDDKNLVIYSRSRYLRYFVYYPRILNGYRVRNRNVFALKLPFPKMQPAVVVELSVTNFRIVKYEQNTRVDCRGGHRGCTAYRTHNRRQWALRFPHKYFFLSYFPLKFSL